jgi:hypothetical protein
MVKPNNRAQKHTFNSGIFEAIIQLFIPKAGVSDPRDFIKMVMFSGFIGIFRLKGIRFEQVSTSSVQRCLNALIH